MADSSQSKLFDRATRRREMLLDTFEEAWVAGAPRSIGEVLVCWDGERLPLLVELVHVELELRWKQGEPVRVDEFFARFPELRSDADVVVDLIMAEWDMRQRAGLPLSVADFYRRFPGDCERLAARELARRGADGPPAMVSGRRTIVLAVVDGPHRNGRHRTDAAAVLVGRGPEAGFQLDRDLHLSRLHFRLEWDGEVLSLHDLGSHNGTQVNGRAVTRCELRHGDVVAAGTTRMAVLLWEN